MKNPPMHCVAISLMAVLAQSVFLCTPACDAALSCSAAERAAHYEEALAHAKASGKDIVVLQRGSDWNRLGEMIYNDIWLKDEFARKLGDRFILVTVDLPEQEGARALQGPYSAAEAGRSDMQAGASTSMRLEKLSQDQTPLPANEVTAVEAKDASVFKRRADGTWLAEGPNPAL